MASSDRAIVLLRGINVGGHHAVSMAALRTLFADSLGCGDVSTYIQSGNLVCTPPPTGLTASVVSHAIEERFGFSVPVALRTEAEWNALIAANPFVARGVGADPETNTLHAVFLDSPMAENYLQLLAARKAAEEQIVAQERELYLRLPLGVGRSKLALAVCAQKMPGSPTMRNWRTALALAAML